MKSSTIGLGLSFGQNLSRNKHLLLHKKNWKKKPQCWPALTASGCQVKKTLKTLVGLGYIPWTTTGSLKNPYDDYRDLRSQPLIKERPKLQFLW